MKAPDANLMLDPGRHVVISDEVPAFSGNERHPLDLLKENISQLAVVEGTSATIRSIAAAHTTRRCWSAQ